ncbi:hypothetical protein C4375_13760 [Devosia sp. I507]|nr:hypothetical protein C4375_13760 [Devosia sp. I507]
MCRAGSAVGSKVLRNKKAPPEGMGGAVRSLAGAADLGGGGFTTKPAVDRNIRYGRLRHKRTIGSAAMQIRMEMDGWPDGAMAQKRGSNRSWSLMIGPKPNRK